MDQSTLNSGCDKGEELVIGKIRVFPEKIIALGCHGTVVFEGTYERRRPAAVKRLVKAYFDVHEEGIANLYAADAYPYIVRLYGLESDRDFTYVAMQRCDCSLYDLVKDEKEKVEFLMQNRYPSSDSLKLMREIVAGLARLHTLRIIHQNLTPHNVLIVKQNGLCPKLSGLGSSMGLPSDNSSLAPCNNGTPGWRAPEQILVSPHTQAVDLFSLGCVLFFCLTQGKHPFGGRFERDFNVTDNNIVNLSLVEHIYEAMDLFPQLLNSKPELRPKASEVLHHPLFWNSEMRMSFLRNTSDWVGLKDRSGYIIATLEHEGREVFPGRWDREMDRELVSLMTRYSRYDYEKVEDLLRFIRVIITNYQELPMMTKALLGTMPEGVDCYIRCRFPKLLMVIYNIMRLHLKQEGWFW